MPFPFDPLIPNDAFPTLGCSRFIAFYIKRKLTDEFPILPIPYIPPSIAF